MEINFKLLESNKSIQDKILKSLLPDVKAYMSRIINKLKSIIPPIIFSTIENSPEYESLLTGQLKYEFGIPDSAQKLAGLLKIWSTNLEYSYVPAKISGSKIISGFSVSALRVDFSDVLYSDYAVMNDNLRGYSLPWLEWLVLEGNKTIIPQHNVQFGPNKYSRTGNAVMKLSSSPWSVPSQFAGDISNNWITRAIDNASQNINKELQEVLKL